ncbi:Hypothetical_protein [Hexamita inflata]|uniref:Hypothetical_protein n=1 Tax=Hexamita inflata TaxID=28002 RepID=A0AA86U3Q8_9EUKA|nr:Hypothetical protein HINF_LOCUS17448 [Hexamita inflata]
MSDTTAQAVIINYIFFLVLLGIIILLMVINFSYRLFVKKLGERLLLSHIPVQPLEYMKNKSKHVKLLFKTIDETIINRIQQQDVKIAVENSQCPQLVPLQQNSDSTMIIPLHLNISMSQEISTQHFQAFGHLQSYLDLNKLFLNIKSPAVTTYKYIYNQIIYGEPQVCQDYTLIKQFGEAKEDIIKTMNQK